MNQIEDICQKNNNSSIFNSITEVDDEEITIFNEDNNDEDIDEIPIIFPMSKLLEKYIGFNHQYHVSFLTLLKIVLSYDENIDSKSLFINNENINSYFHKIFLPRHSPKTVSII